MTPVSIHPLGALLALIFVVSMSSLLWWMLHLPPVVPYEVARITSEVQAIRRILVPVVDTDYSRRAIELATRLGAEQKAEIVLLYVLEVPFTLPLGAALPGAEEKAHHILKQAQEIVAFHHLPYRSRIMRARTAGSGILEAVKEEEADMVVMGVRPPRGEHIPLTRTPEWLLKYANCEVVIDKLPA
ncbi:Nucleotide-binding universal stress protein, UspA family [Thermanaeromonas toyohensis ToBE]|uniref:Nucleotide-binding universal stress protein, UspA family n=1 Tax=Thermanaeromonas toyohensis ToBE TaxID=698762 RepID=A0A1W1V9L4_9FIRM|nr:universal stress protein [Thermanaeromonas toyohensis]SMB89973.1 Nucleotide-binding universal stress protein, UspA family [Thermanaeromonas toyohensis ToBE]